MNYSEPSQFFESMPDTLAMHSKCPDIDLQTYRRINKIELAHAVMQKKRVYLDTMYWVRFRDVVLGRNQDPVHAELYAVLKKACNKEVLICPVSYSAIAELLNQDDMNTRLTTARLMDELSGGVCIERPDYLFINEVDCFLGQVCFQESSQNAPCDLAWTKAAFFVGQPTLTTDDLTDEQVLALQKCIDDGMSSLSVEKLVQGLGKHPKMKSGHRHDWMKKITQQTTDELNSEKSKAENLLPDFQQYVESEVIGIVDSMQPVLGPILEQVMRKAGYDKTSTETELALCSEILKRLLINAYKFGKVNSKVPQLYIWASLHALVRYDKKRNYKNNDYEDFRHAGSALPYCHVFLTEKSLTHMMKYPPASITEQFACAVFSKPSEALKYLKKMAF